MGKPRHRDFKSFGPRQTASVSTARAGLSACLCLSLHDPSLPLALSPAFLSIIKEAICICNITRIILFPRIKIYKYICAVGFFFTYLF